MQPAELSEVGPRWGFRIVGLVAVVIVVVVGAFLLRRAFAGGDTTTVVYQPYTVGTMTLQAKVSTSGTAVSENEAELAFTMAGQVNKIYVKLGDPVRAGQSLVSLKADQVQNAAATAQSALALAKLRLRKLQEGATDTDIGRAYEAVAAAEAALTMAENALQDAVDPPTDAEVTASRQAVAGAEAALAAAQAKLQMLKDGATDADIAAAESAVTKAEKGLSQAERSKDEAENQEADAQSAFEYAATQYCSLTGHLQPVCDDLANHAYEVPLTSDQVSDLSESIQPSAIPTPTPQLALAVADLTTASSTYRGAIVAVGNAEDAVAAAQSMVDAAEEALDQAEKGATAEDIDAGQKAVDSANAALAAGQAALQKLLDGATDTTIANLNAAVSKAQADFLAATIAQNEVLAGAKPTDLAMEQEDVRQAELTLERANIALRDATLTSPFDGVVSLLPVKIGQIVSPAVSAVTVLVPGTLVLELNVGETELPSIRPGETGSVMFDALPGKFFPIQVYAVGLSPATEQGIIIYKVRCTITGDMSDASQPRPSPGMSGTASIVTQEKPNVVAIPSAAIRSSAGASVVAVMDDDGKVAMRPVQTGLSDGDNIEVVSGLSVGDKIGMRVLATPTKTSDTQEIPGHFQ